MNERIRKLISQAGGIGYDDDGNELTPALVGSGLEKFAELIVEECGEIAYKAYWDNPESVRGIHIKEKIKQHFGVEE